MSQSLPSSFYESRFTNLKERNLGLHSSFGGGPVIILCSNAYMYRAYARRTKQATQSSDNELVHFVSKPCGPHKLAKAFAFCLSNASHPENRGSQLSPLQTLSKGLAFPQSLLNISPDSSFHLGEVHSSGGYVPTGAESLPWSTLEANEPSAPATYTSKATQRKPVLLLVEDNHINMKVCLDSERY